MTSQSKDALPDRVPFSAYTVWRDTADHALGSACRLDRPNVVDTFGRQSGGGKWHTLIDKGYSELNLYLADRKVTGKQGAAGVDGQTCEAFEEHLIVEVHNRFAQSHVGTY
jgi:hypothetical protein